MKTLASLRSQGFCFGEKCLDYFPRFNCIKTLNALST